MARNNLKKSLYAGQQIVLTTKHAKALAIAPVFLEKLDAKVIEYVVDTDQLGTFSGEIIRKKTPLECAQEKCEWPLREAKRDNKIKFMLASEGSFGPHPAMPFFPGDHEILYFIDYQRKFHLYLSHVSEKTNYRMQVVEDFQELHQFATETLFPSHALIVRPNQVGSEKLLFKGITNIAILEEAFKESKKSAADKKVWVETDMRAQFNPSRMAVIAELADKLAQQLQRHCPKCDNPGWGKIKQELGLPCGWCGIAAELVKTEIFGCVKCDYKENMHRADGKKNADPANCQYCNP